jgi:putative ABC transport system permease protein
VISYSVAQRTHELGVRAALGAGAGDQIRLVLSGGMAMAGAGLGIGAVGAWAVSRLIETLLFGVSPRDPWVLLGVGGILLAVAGAACCAPARRALRIDPVVALRYE